MSKRPIRDEQIIYPDSQFQLPHTPDKKMIVFYKRKILHFDILHWFRAMPIFAFTPYYCVLSREATKYRFYSFWFDPTGVRTHDLPHTLIIKPPMVVETISIVRDEFFIWPKITNAAIYPFPFIPLCIF
jgi:hypothetical protein